ncbi:MAG: ion transporter [Theionarchaea archaeon]|nr:ion transporter [Theionarchaea archaeon]MBU7019668.1 ion transporter [Theionarchaea archaeon]MBU7034589.1 ion transporter [Theionarchaea archaeon]MBU7041314.1 ion transporter [Theionarchaea archaeon]
MIKTRLYQILEVASENDPLSRLFDVFIMALIFLNVLAVVLETVESIFAVYESVFYAFEVFSVIVFTVEYVLRLWVCTASKKGAHPLTDRLRFMAKPMSLIDLVAILPFYLPVVFPMDPRFLRALRLFRLFRLFKMGRYSESLLTLGNVLKAKKEEIVVTFFVISLMLVFASSTIYYVEHDAQPEAFSSIPAAMWWGVATLTTVGYGDVYPITPVGKFLGAVIALLGIGMFALPAGILASGFAEELQKKHSLGRRICPHCGRDLDEPPD